MLSCSAQAFVSFNLLNYRVSKQVCSWLTQTSLGSLVNIDKNFINSVKTLTNPRDALHHGERAANKGGRSV